MKHIVSQIINHVEAGTSLAKALKSASPLFDPFYCDLVATGEQTGRLEQVFTRIFTYREKSEETRKKVVKAMIYPAIVCLIATLVTVGMLLFVIPTFKGVFSAFGAELPWFTRQVLNTSDALSKGGHYVLLMVFSLALLCRLLLRKSAAFRHRISRLSLHLPVVGDVITKATIARFTRTLATTFSAGIPLLQGLYAAAKTANHLHYQTVIEDIHRQTAGGRPLHRAIRETGQFPDMMSQMVMIGEESGALDEMLNKIATIYESEVDNTVDNLGKILEPMIILLLGLLIGALVIAMYLPMFNLMSVMG